MQLSTLINEILSVKRFVIYVLKQLYNNEVGRYKMHFILEHKVKFFKVMTKNVLRKLYKLINKIQNTLLFIL